MRFKKRNRIIVFILLILLNLIIRFPVIPHEVGMDTYYIHDTLDVITTFGEVKFINHPLQFLGFSSQPPSVPLLISGLAQTMGLSSEYVILMFSLIVTILGTFTYYILIYYVTGNEFQSFFATLIFSTAPEFMRLTLWTATTRALFIGLFPLYFYFLLKSLDTNKRLTSVLLFTLLFAMLLSTHHMGVLLLLALFTFAVTVLLTNNKFEITINNKRLPDLMIWSALLIIILSLIVFRVGFIGENPNLWIIYTAGTFFQGDSPHVLLFNMVIDYASKISILTFLVPVGIFALFYFKNRRSLFENYSLITIIFTAPILAVGIYTPMFLLIILTFLLSVGITTLLKINRTKKAMKILVPSFIVISLCFSSFMLFQWGYKSIESDVDRYMPETKNVATFLNMYGGEGSFTSNERGGNLYKYSAYSGMRGAPGSKYDETVELKPKLNLNASELASGDIENIIGFVNVKKNSSIENKNSSRISNTDVWYQFPILWAGSVDEGKDMIDEYNIKYVLETQFGGYSVSYVKNMKFFNDVHECKSKVYDNSKEEIYFLQ